MVQRKVVKVSEAKRAAPPVDPVEARRKSLHSTLLSSVSELDVQEVAGTLVAKAKQGDLKAINLLIGLLQGGGGQRQQVVVQQSPAHGQPVIEVIQPRLLGTKPTAEEVLQAQRIEVADIIRSEGPKSAGYLGTRIAADTGRIREVLTHTWFEERTGGQGWGLTQEGWTATKEDEL